MERLAGQQVQLAERQQTLDERHADLTERQTSIDAAIERMDRILDYLMRRDGQRPEDESDPQR